MKLAEFLADYIVTERQRDTIGDVGCNLQDIIQTGIEAFAKSIDYSISIVDSDGKHRETFYK